MLPDRHKQPPPRPFRLSHQCRSESVGRMTKNQFRPLRSSKSATSHGNRPAPAAGCCPRGRQLSRPHGFLSTAYRTTAPPMASARNAAIMNSSPKCGTIREKLKAATGFRRRPDGRWSPPQPTSAPHRLGNRKCGKPAGHRSAEWSWRTPPALHTSRTSVPADEEVGLQAWRASFSQGPSTHPLCLILYSRLWRNQKGPPQNSVGGYQSVVKWDPVPDFLIGD